ncbi:hypothetical protein BGW38_006365, partial [Lunasporangiospora selenospora]
MTDANTTTPVVDATVAPAQVPKEETPAVVVATTEPVETPAAETKDESAAAADVE